MIIIVFLALIKAPKDSNSISYSYTIPIVPIFYIVQTAFDPSPTKNNEKDKHKDNDDDKYIYRTPSNGNPRAGEVGKLLTFLTIQNLKA